MITLDHVCFSYGENMVFKDLNLHINPGETVAIMASSGKGKTTLLRLITGLVQPQSGTIRIGSCSLRTAYQFQEPRLFPWLTALGNVNLFLGDKKATIPEAMKWLDAVELSDAATLYPEELSGGMCKRVALAMTLAYGGDLYLFDEPFSGLDHACRIRMANLIRKQTEGSTVLLVTHDPVEAELLSARIVTLA